MCRALQIPLFILLAVSATLMGCRSQNTNGGSQSIVPQSIMPQLTPTPASPPRSYEDNSSKVPPQPVITPAPAAEEGDDSFSSARPVKRRPGIFTREDQQPRGALFANKMSLPKWNWPTTFRNPFQMRASESVGQTKDQPENGIPPAPEDSANKLRRYWLPLTESQLTAERKKVYPQDELQQPVALGYEPVPYAAPSHKLAGRTHTRQHRETVFRSGPSDWKDADWLSPTNVNDWNRTHPTQAGPSQSIVPVMSVPEHINSKDLEQWPHHEREVRSPQQPTRELQRPTFADEEQTGNMLILPRR